MGIGIPEMGISFISLGGKLLHETNHTNRNKLHCTIFCNET